MKIKEKLYEILQTDLNKKIFSHSFWILAGNVISKFFLLFATIIMARYLGKEEYGQFGMIKSTILMFAMFAGMELGMTATKYLSQYRLTNKRKVEKIIGLSNFFAIIISLFFSVVVYFFAEEISAIIKAPFLFKEIRISSFILFFSALNGIQNGILAGLERFKEMSINNVIAGVVSSIGLIICSVFFNLDAVVIAFGLNFLLLFIFNFISLKKYFYSEYKIEIFNKYNFSEINVILKFSLPAILGGLMVGPVTWFCNSILVSQQNGYLHMASFDIANQWRNTILFIPTALSQIALPLLASNLEDREQYKLIFRKNLFLNIYIGGGMSLLFVLSSPFIVKFYGNAYNDALYPLIIMFITTAFITVNNVVGQAIASKGKMWFGFYFNLLWACILIFSYYFLVIKLQYGAIGATISYLLSYLLHTVVQFVFLKRIMHN